MFLGPRVVFKLIARRPHLVDTIISKHFPFDFNVEVLGVDGKF